MSSGRRSRDGRHQAKITGGSEDRGLTVHETLDSNV
jgi:hypothetical protein